MPFDLIKYNKTKRSPAIDPTKVVVVYDSSIAGTNELDLVNAYVAARGLNSSHIYPIDIGQTYRNSTIADIRTAWLDDLGAYVIANNIEAICCSPNCPTIITSGQGGYSSDGVSMSALLSIAKKVGLYGPSEAITPTIATQRVSLNNPSSILTSSSLGDNVNSRTGAIDYELLDSSDDVVEIGGVDITNFEAGDDEPDYSRIPIDQGRDNDRFGFTMELLPAWRIGYPDGSNGTAPDITPAMITTMVNNAIAMEDTLENQKTNLDVAVLANQRTSRISNGSSTQCHHALNTYGFANLKFGYTTNAQTNLSTIATQTGITTYNPSNNLFDFTISRGVASASADSSTLRSIPATVFSSISEYESFNGTTFPISVGLLNDTGTTNTILNSDYPGFDSGDGKQVFDLQAGAHVLLPTSFGHRTTARAIQNGAAAVYSSYNEPADTGVGNGNDTIMYLLRGYEAATARMLDTALNWNQAELWGDGLARLVTDVPVDSSPETTDSLSFNFTSEVAQNYGGIVTGMLANTCGYGAYSIPSFNNAIEQSVDGPRQFNLIGFLDCESAGLGALLASPPYTTGFAIFTNLETVNELHIGEEFPYDYVRITDKLDAGRLDLVLNKSDLGLGLATVGGFYDAGWVIDGKIGLENNREYIVELRGLPLDYISVKSNYLINPQPSPTYGQDSWSATGPDGFVGYDKFVQDNTVNFLNNAVAEVTIRRLDSAKTQVGSTLITTSTRAVVTNQKGVADTLQETLTQTQADLTTALANAGESYDPITNLTVNVPNGGLFVESNGVKALTRTFDEGTWHANDDSVKVDISSAVITSGTCVIVTGQASGDTAGIQGTLTLENKDDAKAIVAYDVTLS